MKKVVYVGGMRALVIYLLLNIKDLKESIFFLANDFKVNLEKKYVLNEEGNKYVARYRNYKLLKKYTFDNEKKEFWIQDHLKYSPFFLGNFKDLILLEDGIGNYIEVNKKINKRIKYSIKNLILGGTFRLDKRKFGNSPKIKKIYLTSLDKIPVEIINKVEIINLKKIWNSLRLEERQKILDIFLVKEETIKKIKNKKIILITDPLSEILEEEKIEIYKKLIKEYKEEELLIKPHPRETMNYKRYFSKIDVLEKDFPTELISFLVEDLKEVVTLFSTGAFDFKKIANVRFLGTKFNEKLLEKYGEIGEFNIQRINVEDVV